MKRIPILGLLVLVLGTSSCATPNEIQQALRIRELESIVVGLQDDNGYLLREIAKQEVYIMQLHRGMELQARMAAGWRNNCES